MMPQLVTVRVTRQDRRPIRIWVPVLPLVLLFSPIVLLAVLGAAVACQIYRIDVIPALGAGWRIVSALPGTRLGFEESGTNVLVTIR